MLVIQDRFTETSLWGSLLAVVSSVIDANLTWQQFETSLALFRPLLALTWQPSQCQRFAQLSARQLGSPPQFFRAQSGHTTNPSIATADNRADGATLTRGHEDCKPAWGTTHCRGRHHSFKTAVLDPLRMSERKLTSSTFQRCSTLGKMMLSRVNKSTINNKKTFLILYK